MKETPLNKIAIFLLCGPLLVCVPVLESAAADQDAEAIRERLAPFFVLIATQIQAIFAARSEPGQWLPAESAGTCWG